MIQNETNNDYPEWVKEQLAELTAPIRDLILKYGGIKADSFVVMVNTDGAGLYEAKPGIDVNSDFTKKKFLDEFLDDLPSQKGGLFGSILKDMLAGMALPADRKPTEAQIQWVRDNADLIQESHAKAGIVRPAKNIRRDASFFAQVINTPCDCNDPECDKQRLFERMTADLLAGQHPAG